MIQKIQKRILVLDRVRRPPATGFSWVDRRFLHEIASGLSRDAILLYLFLAAVSDKHGLSYWKDATVAGRLKLDEEAIAGARAELVRRDLVAHERPLTQVLSLPERRPRDEGDGRPRPVGEILRQIMERGR